jgi:tRNA (uracil-5-)-methyltransferase
LYNATDIKTQKVEMNCRYFGECGSCVVGGSLDEQRERKIDMMRSVFGGLWSGEFEWFGSPSSHYRARAEFGIWHDGERISYTMNGIRAKKICIDECPKCDEAIGRMMEPLLAALEGDETLRRSLFGVQFLGARDELLVSLIYHKKLDEIWEARTRPVAEELGVKLIGRSRAQKLVIGADYVCERLEVDGKSYRFKIYEGAFSQPNRAVNEQMIGWAARQARSGVRDLLELYCGHGNFTVPMSFGFGKVLATEISKASIRAALENCDLNGAHNITFVRLSSEELTEALNGGREFRRLEGVELGAFDFSHVFVDPPRAGLDEPSREFLRRFEHIIYISCNPATLARDLAQLSSTHEITAFALFDQFPYTHHLESGVAMRRR